MKQVIVDGVPVFVETRVEKVEWYVRNHPGVSAAKLDRVLGDWAGSIAGSLYTDGILRSWRADVGIWEGKPWRGYRYAHVITPRDAVMDDEIIDFDAERARGRSEGLS